MEIDTRITTSWTIEVIVLGKNKWRANFSYIRQWRQKKVQFLLYSLIKGENADNSHCWRPKITPSEIFVSQVSTVDCFIMENLTIMNELCRSLQSEKLQ